jgi:hypothetical protein
LAAPEQNCSKSWSVGFWKSTRYSGANGTKTPKGGGAGGGGSGKTPEIDPIIRGLLARLPKSGDVWPEAQRKLWLELLAGSFKLIYKDAPPSDGQHEAER